MARSGALGRPGPDDHASWYAEGDVTCLWIAARGEAIVELSLEQLIAPNEG